VGVVIFFSMMRSYFCFLVAAFRPCHGREPRQKYNITYPSDSMSSRRDCSTRDISWEEQKGDLINIPTPKWVLMEA
jgi:hypothetical protein